MPLSLVPEKLIPLPTKAKLARIDPAHTILVTIVLLVVGSSISNLTIIVVTASVGAALLAYGTFFGGAAGELQLLRYLALLDSMPHEHTKLVAKRLRKIGSAESHDYEWLAAHNDGTLKQREFQFDLERASKLLN